MYFSLISSYVFRIYCSGLIQLRGEGDYAETCRGSLGVKYILVELCVLLVLLTGKVIPLKVLRVPGG
jgi:hypothetical protein